jgi:hypothetical protein
MKILFRLLLVIAAIAFAVIAWLEAPVLRQMITCYDRNLESMDDAGYMSQTRGWDVGYVCQIKQNHLVTLEQCLAEADNIDVITKPIRKYTIGFLKFVRPMRPDLEGLKSIHDADCMQYPTTMFYPPY